MVPISKSKHNPRPKLAPNKTPPPPGGVFLSAGAVVTLARLRQGSSAGRFVLVRQLTLGMRAGSRTLRALLVLGLLLPAVVSDDALVFLHVRKMLGGNRRSEGTETGLTN